MLYIEIGNYIFKISKYDKGFYKKDKNSLFDEITNTLTINDIRYLIILLKSEIDIDYKIDDYIHLVNDKK